MVAQHTLDAQAAAGQRLARVTDARGSARTRAERGRGRTVAYCFGPVRVRRLADRGAGAEPLSPGRGAELAGPAVFLAGAAGGGAVRAGGFV